MSPSDIGKSLKSLKFNNNLQKGVHNIYLFYLFKHLFAIIKTHNTVYKQSQKTLETDKTDSPG